MVGDELGSLTFFDVRKGNVQLACLHRLHHDAVRAITSPVRGRFRHSYVRVEGLAFPALQLPSLALSDHLSGLTITLCQALSFEAFIR